jgi:hypothetical protein
MRQIIIALAMLGRLVSSSQNIIKYRLCTNCLTGENASNINTTYNYGTATNYNSVGVTSDFGAIISHDNHYL